MRPWLAVLLGACSAPHPAAIGDAASAPDARASDARVADADLSGATDVPVVPCTDSDAAVYAATPRAGAPLGTILACARDAELDVAAVQAAIGSGVTATSGVAQYVIAYQTRDGDGGPAVSTARVYLPHVPRARPVPLAVAAHGSVGLADSCAPSTAADNSLPMPYAGTGIAAIAPDLAGLGNAGTQDYLDNRAQGWQLLDGARALRALLPPGLTAPQLILAGYSQGGGAVLSAQALIGADGPDAGQLVATVAFAPEWPIALGSFDYVGMLDDPTQLTISAGLSYSSVAVLRQYAFFENHVGAGTGKLSVPAQFQGSIDNAVDSNCLVAFGAYVQLQMLHTGDLIDGTLRTGLLSCIGAQGCDGNASAYYNFLLANDLSSDPHAGPVLLVQGLLDQIMPAGQNAACIRDKLVSWGVATSACAFAASDHTDIMDQHATGVVWAEAELDGVPPPACPETTALPACQ